MKLKNWLLLTYPLLGAIQLTAFLNPAYVIQGMAGYVRGPLFAAVVTTGVVLALASVSEVTIPRKALLVGIGVLGFGAWAFVSGTFKHEWEATIYALWYILGAVYHLLLLPIIIKDRDTLLVFLRLLAWVTSGFSILSLANGSMLGGRLTGLFYRPNSLAIVALVSAVSSVTNGATSQTLWHKRAWYLVAFLSLVVLTLTRTRATALAFAAAFSIWILMARWPRRRTYFTFGYLVVAALTIWVLASPVGKDFLRFDATAQPLGADRLAMWGFAIRSLEYVGISGLGLGSQAKAWSVSRAEMPNNIPFLPMDIGFHNSYLEVALETGVFGALLWLLPLCSLVIVTTIQVARSQTWHPEIVGSLALLMALLLDGVFESSLILPTSPGYLFEWLAIAVLVSSRGEVT